MLLEPTYVENPVAFKVADYIDIILYPNKN